MSSSGAVSAVSDYQKPVDVGKTDKRSKRPYWIGFIVFLVLAIGLLFFVLWWFLWRDAPNPLKTACSSDQQCLPNEFCNSGICNAVQCLVQSDCNKVANGAGGAVCVGAIGNQKGYCQTATCETSTDCADFGDDYICSVFQPDPATPWIASACVQTGQSCSSDRDCFGGNSGLFCVIPEGGNGGVCQQCRDNGDCGLPGGNGNWVCNSGVCTECSASNDMCNDGSSGTANWTCNNGSCCSSPQYMVNGLMSCQQGELFDSCLQNGDCKSGHCINLGTPNGGEDDVMICGGGTNGTMTFSAGSIISSGAGNPATIATFTCDTPGGPSDTTTNPFAVNGQCAIYSATNTTGATGGACGKPAYCRQTAHSSNLLCTGDVTFQNPYVTVCTDNDDCSALGASWGCGNDNICGQGCNSAADCDLGFACQSTNTPPSGFTGICSNPTDQIICTMDQCPSPNAVGCPCANGYTCSSSKGQTPTCTWSNTEEGNPTSIPPPPPPLIVTSVCTRPATALPQVDPDDPTSGAIAFIPSYCTNGFCNTTPGWINSVCVGDGDCMFLQGNPNTNVRTSLLCRDDGTGDGFNVCTGN